MENTSDLVYKHIMVEVREGAQPAPIWDDPWPPDNFYTSGLVCNDPSPVHFQKPNKLKPGQTGHAYDFFQREDDVPFYTLYYIICTWHELSGECTEGEFDFVNFQPLDFFAIEMVPCWLDPGPLKTEVDSLGEGMTARIMYRDESAMYGYFRLSNESMCWMDLTLLMFDPPEGSENIIFDVLSVPVYDMDENGNGQVNGNGHAPMFDTNMFYYGGGCTPQQVMVEFMPAEEEASNAVTFFRPPDVESVRNMASTGVSMSVVGIDYNVIMFDRPQSVDSGEKTAWTEVSMDAIGNSYNVVMFSRLQDMESGEKTEWNEGVSMNEIGNGYYGRILTSAEIPDHEMYKNAYVQLQFIVTNPDGEVISRSPVYPDLLMLSRCGTGGPPPSGPSSTPTTTPRAKLCVISTIITVSIITTASVFGAF